MVSFLQYTLMWWKMLVICSLLLNWCISTNHNKYHHVTYVVFVFMLPTLHVGLINGCGYVFMWQLILCVKGRGQC